MQKLIQHVKQNPLHLFAFVTVFSILLIGWNIFSIVRLDRKTRNVVMYSQELAELEETQIFLLKQELAELEYLLTGDTEFIIRHKEFETLANFHLNEAERFQERPQERKIIDQIIIDRDAYEISFKEAVELYQAGDVDEAIRVAEEVSDASIQDVHRLVEEYVTIVETDVEAEISAADQIATISIIISAVALALFIFIALIAYNVSNRVLRPIVLLTVGISALVVGWNIQNLWRIDRTINEAVHQTEELAEIEEVQVFLLEQEVVQIEYLLSGTQNYLDDHEAFGKEVEHHFERALAFQTTDEETAVLETIAKDRVLYEAAIDDSMAAYQRGDLEEATRLSVEVAGAALEDVHDHVEEFVVVEESQLREKLAAMDRLTQTALTIGIFTLVIFAVESIVATTITGQVLMPVLRLIDAAKSIENETYDMSMLDGVALQEDEIGHLARVFQQLSKTVFARTEKLKEQVVELKIEIDETKSSKQAQKIMESDFFKGLEESASIVRTQRKRRLKRRRKGDDQ